MPARILGAARDHPALSALLVVGAALRGATEAAFWPALSYAGDSALYLKMAWTGAPVLTVPERPSGYPMAIDLLTEPGRALGALTIWQHLAGLAAGVLVYAIARRVALPKWAAAVAAAFVLLNSHQIVLEQMVLAESLFTLLLLGSVYLVIGPDRGPAALAASGVLLGLAATMRLAAVYAIVIWAAYVLWAHRPPIRVAAIAAAGLATPLLAYSTWHAIEEGTFGFDQASGWFLYGRIAEIGDCGDADVPEKSRALCARVPQDDREGAGWHLWNAEGSAHRILGRLNPSPERAAETDDILGSFAWAIIRDRPLRFAGLVGEDVLRYFAPGQRARYISDLAIEFPAEDRLGQLTPPVREQFAPDFEPRRRAPAGALDAYESVMHTPRWLMAGFALASLAALVLALLGRGIAARREIVLLSGTALLMLVASTATSEFVFRYFVPLVPLLVLGGLLSLREIRQVALKGAPAMPTSRAGAPA